MAFLYCRECSILWHEEGAREAQERVQHHQRCLTALNAALSPPEPTEQPTRGQIASKILTEVVGLDLTNLERARVASELAADAVCRLFHAMPLQDHAGKVVADEREACAQIADYVSGRAAKAAMEMSYSELYGENCKVEAADEIANAIRARAMVAEDQTSGAK